MKNKEIEQNFRPASIELKKFFDLFAESYNNENEKNLLFELPENIIFLIDKIIFEDKVKIDLVILKAIYNKISPLSSLVKDKNTSFFEWLKFLNYKNLDNKKKIEISEKEIFTLFEWNWDNIWEKDFKKWEKESNFIPYFKKNIQTNLLSRIGQGEQNSQDFIEKLSKKILDIIFQKTYFSLQISKYIFELCMELAKKEEKFLLGQLELNTKKRDLICFSLSKNKDFVLRSLSIIKIIEENKQFPFSNDFFELRSRIHLNQTMNHSNTWTSTFCIEDKIFKPWFFLFSHSFIYNLQEEKVNFFQYSLSENLIFLKKYQKQ